MNPIDLAIRHISSRIPAELISKAFKPDYLFGRYDTITPEFLIRKEVIEGIVLQDLNIVGGQHVTLDLTSLNPTMIEGAMVYRIPLRMTAGRHISRVISVDYSSGTTLDLTGDALGDGAIKSLNATGNYQSPGTANVELVGPNTVAIYEYVSGTAALRCVLNYDDQMSSMNQAYFRDFMELCLRAAEYTIFNKISISLGSGSANGGTPNTYLRERVDSMRDSTQLYDELLNTKWTKISIMSDKKSHMEMCSMLTG